MYHMWLLAARREYQFGTLTRAYMYGWLSLGHSWKTAIERAKNFEIPPITF